MSWKDLKLGRKYAAELYVFPGDKPTEKKTIVQFECVGSRGPDDKKEFKICSSKQFFWIYGGGFIFLNVKDLDGNDASGAASIGSFVYESLKEIY